MPVGTNHKSTLISWIGANDLKAAEANGDTGAVLSGPQGGRAAQVQRGMAYQLPSASPLLAKNSTISFTPVPYEGIDGVFTPDDVSDLNAVLKPFLKAEGQPTDSQE